MLCVPIRIASLKIRKSHEIIPTTIMFAVMWFLLRTQEQVRNSRGKRTISVRATGYLMYTTQVR